MTWGSGTHTTYLSLNNCPTTAMAGRAVTLNANLTDDSVEPPAPVAGAQIQFSVDNQTCFGTTASNGTASCALTVPDVGSFTLTAFYSGTGSELPATATTLFTATAFSDVIFADGFDGNP